MKKSFQKFLKAFVPQAGSDSYRIEPAHLTVHDFVPIAIGTYAATTLILSMIIGGALLGISLFQLDYDIRIFYKILYVNFALHLFNRCFN